MINVVSFSRELPWCCTRSGDVILDTSGRCYVTSVDLHIDASSNPSRVCALKFNILMRNIKIEKKMSFGVCGPGDKFGIKSYNLFSKIYSIRFISLQRLQNAILYLHEQFSSFEPYHSLIQSGGLTGN